MKYICKCGRIVRKNSTAASTGNRDFAECIGCPYLLPWGEQVYTEGKGFHLKVKGYECRMSPTLEYASRFSGSVTDKCTCYVVSLDYEFLTQINNWIRATYPNGELSGSFSLENIRPTDFSDNGRYRYSLYCAQNKKGIAAKAALKDFFFNPDGSRKDMTPEQEEKKIKDLIENGKRAAQGGAAEPEKTTAPKNEYPEEYPINNECQCVSCTCTGCHEVCFGHCQGCGNPTRGCNSYQTGGEKFLPAAPAAADTDSTTETLATVSEALPAFDYSGLEAETATRLQNLARRALESKQRYYLDMMEIVFEAHRELCDTVVARCDNGQFNQKESTFRAWCASIGVSKDAAYRLLQVQALMDNSTPEEQEILEQAQPSLLYAAAKPSAPAEAVAVVKSGDITTYKEYQDLMKRIKLLETQNQSLLHSYETEKGRAEAAKQRAANVEKDMDNLIAENDENIEKLHKTREQLEAKEREVRDAKNAKEITQQSLNQVSYDLESTRSMLKKTQKRANMIENERSAAVALLNETREELATLQSRPIEVAVAEPDPVEIERLATEKAEGIAAQRTAELRAQVDKLQQEAQESRAQDAEDLKMQDYDTVLFAISVIQNAWKSAGPSFRRLDDQCRAQLRRNLMERIAEIEKAVNVC